MFSIYAPKYTFGHSLWKHLSLYKNIRKMKNPGERIFRGIYLESYVFRCRTDRKGKNMKNMVCCALYRGGAVVIRQYQEASNPIYI